MRRASARPGFAAALAVCMLAAVAGLAVASFYSVVEARRSAHRARRQEQAAGAADAALFRFLATWDDPRRDSLAIGRTDSSSGDPGGRDSVKARVFVTRITDRLFWLTSAGGAASGTSAAASRVHHLLLEVRQPTILARAALTSRGAVLAGIGAQIVGGDAPPPEWTDCAAADTGSAPAVLVPEAGVARFDDGAPIPNTLADSGAGTPATYELLGRVSTASLAARADITLAPGAILSPAPDSDADCRRGGTATPGSWGEPVRAGRSEGCERFYPVVHAAGDLTVTGGRGQGVLLVSGRLRVEGPFLFYGVVIASGAVVVSGPDVRAYGAILSAAEGVTWRAGGELRRSTCAVGRVAQAAAKAYPVPLRPWAELF
ncbi:MAG: hypothetical protein ABR499_04735 [Gemmatimonadaceae bacterium]